MNKLQASMKDRSAQTWKEAKEYYRVGSAFKGCNNCGEVNEKGMFVTGLEVVRSYKPQNKGWTYMCMTCSAKDEACWTQAWDIGQEPRLLPREEMAKYRKEMRDLHFPKETVAKHEKLSERELKIMKLEAQMAALKQILGGVK